MKRQELVLANQAKQDNKIAIEKAITKEKKAFEKRLRDAQDLLEELEEKLNDRLDSEVTLEYTIIEADLLNMHKLQLSINLMTKFIETNYGN